MYIIPIYVCILLSDGAEQGGFSFYSLRYVEDHNDHNDNDNNNEILAKWPTDHIPPHVPDTQQYFISHDNH